MESQKCKDRIKKHLRGRISDLNKLWKGYQEGNEDIEDLGNIFEYGLCFDYVPRENKHGGFFRYQLSTGGPGDEFRFYCDVDKQVYKIEYWFLDWFDGASLKLYGKRYELLKEIFEWFKEGGALEKAIEDSK